ncbi:hypothetical protein Dacet_0886 [Denitrovibrio acetiphilus DSM 12809]|jgi:hypothetical protein|uniref:SnoaL-like domain-containing protein n=1 Tax=Denitrovibrio acetiphilus (strain DSM 12809 / NBRC 114555 / N2460) TaxID=522772 RepID=D4H619_DENA2|nr:hypothetical protein [Denitrovibrio acetiphilus]ADD67665.1 hypothetical protein Dacet_0886 [Denitrovibrio acetiphilus DSM 12809]
MKNNINHFINDFYSDIDSLEDTKYIVEKYFAHEAALSHYGEISKGREAVEDWYDAIKAGFSESMHQIKNVEYKAFEDVYAVRADVVWTAAFRNIEKKNMIRYKTVVRMDLIECSGRLQIKNYKSIAVG